MAKVKAICVANDATDERLLVYYPVWFVKQSVSWKRLFVRRKTVRIYVCVDGVRGIASRADTLPPAVDVEVPQERVLPLALVEGEALKRAESLAHRWATTRMFSWWAPSVDSLECHLYYRPYLVESGPESSALRDLVSGESIPL